MLLLDKSNATCLYCKLYSQVEPDCFLVWFLVYTCAPNHVRELRGEKSWKNTEECRIDNTTSSASVEADVCATTNQRHGHRHLARAHPLHGIMQSMVLHHQ